jgi:hypothetical protein
MNTKLLTLSIVVLFLGLAVAPSLQADTSNEVLDGELVEVTTEFSGLDGNTTVMLTQEQVQEVDQLFDTIKEQMNNAETKEEIVEIFREAVVELDKYGLLGELSVKQVQKLVIGHQNPTVIDFLEKLNPTPCDENENIFCLTVGKVGNITTQSFFWRVIIYIFFRLLEKDTLFSLFLAEVLLWSVILPLDKLFTNNPILLGGEIDFYDGAKGWVKTMGLFGIKSWNGALMGRIDTIWARNLTAVAGFTGVSIFIDNDSSENFFLGFARYVKIDEIQ